MDPNVLISLSSAPVSRLLMWANNSSSWYPVSLGKRSGNFASISVLFLSRSAKTSSSTVLTGAVSTADCGGCGISCPMFFRLNLLPQSYPPHKNYKRRYQQWIPTEKKRGLVVFLTIYTIGVGSNGGN